MGGLALLLMAWLLPLQQAMHRLIAWVDELAWWGPRMFGRVCTNRTRQGKSAQNLAVIRKLALNLLRRETSVQVGIAATRKRAGWDRKYL